MRDEKAEQILGPHRGRVQRINVGAQALAEHASEIVFRCDLVDLAEFLFERIEPSLLDARRVHEGGVVVGDHTLRSSRLRFAGAGLANQIGITLLSFLKDLEAHSNPGAISRHFSRFSPTTIGIFIEVVARFYRQAAVSEVDTERLFPRGWRGE